MNPLAALLASLTGATPGQATSASTSSEGAGTGPFAGLLAHAGQSGIGEGVLSGTPNGAFPAGTLQGDLLLALGGEGEAAGPAALTQIIHINNVDKDALAGLGLSEAEIDGLLDALAGEGDTLTLGEALTQLAEAGGDLPELSEEQLQELLRQVRPQGDDAEGSDALRPDAEADAAASGVAATSDKQQALLLPGPADAGSAAEGQSGAKPGVAPGEASPPLPAEGGTRPGSSNAAPAGQTQGPAAAFTPTPHNTAASPASAPQAGVAAGAQAGQHSAPQPQAGLDQTQSGQPGQVAAASSNAESSLNDASRIGGAPTDTAEALPQSQPGASKSSLETLLQHAQRAQGTEPIKTDTAVTGAADANTAPQPMRSAAPVTAPPQAQAVPIATIAVSIAQQAQAGAKRFEVRLDPPELGRVDVRIEVTRDGHATTHLVVERSETLDMLQRDARQLERALQNAGLNTSDGDLTFSLKDQGQAHDGARGNGPQQRADEAAPSDEPVEDAWRPLPSRNVSSSGLDIRI